MLAFLLPLALLLQPAVSLNIVRDVRAALSQNDFALAEKLASGYRSVKGVTPEWLEAHSWLGRGALAAKDYERAGRYATETRDLVIEQLKGRALDAERHLPIALGASIEVQAHVLAARGERSEAVAFLERELEAWRKTSIRTRIHKNINLLTLEGRPAPALELRTVLGPAAAPLESLRGRPVLLFFWAHWCGDCKAQAPVLARLLRELPDLVVMGPTQRYGYVARGEDASPEAELRYIEEVRLKYYPALSGMPVPVSEETFRQYGASTTPTLVLIDRTGTVRMYHPGKMTYEELAPRVKAAAAN